ncbi:Uncharacterised protein [Pluralibacter gergoviae]|nr:Uncharacterised protein [Pluralibacter gergoviae]
MKKLAVAALVLSTLSTGAWAHEQGEFFYSGRFGNGKTNGGGARHAWPPQWL